MTVALSEFRTEVLVEISECPTRLVDREIRRAAIEFCEYTLTWRQELDIHYSLAGIQEYDINLEPESRLVAILYVGQDGAQVMPTTERTLDSKVQGWRDTANQSERVQYYYLPNRETIRLSLTPSAGTAISITAALKPTQDAMTLPASIYEDHIEAIGLGAKARLLAMHGKAWSDLQAAAYNKAEFERAKNREKAERLNDYTRQSTLTVRPTNYYS